MKTLRRLALGFASALTLAPALAGAARAGDVTYPQLTTQSTVLDTDLLAIWRGSGPLAKLNASLFSQYVINGLGKSTFLQIGNNLSDLNNQATARSNLGLQSAAQQSIGTSGATLCLLNTNCTWSGTELFQAKVTTGAPSAAGAMFNLAPGAAPTSPINGDVWMTSSGEFERVNGATQQVAYLTSNVASANFATTAGSATNATNATTASNANALGNVAPSGYVQNNGGTYSINITGSAGSANTVNSANTANSATTAGTANALAGLTSSIGSSGVIEIPSSGGTLYIEWGLYDAGCGTCWNTASALSISFPVAFPHTALNVVATTYNPAGIAGPRIPTIYGPSSSGFFAVGNGGNSPEGFYWVAIGY